MKLLLISDEEDKYLWDYYHPGNLDGVDLILSAGDLKANYLSFLVTMANRPLLYVHGNHDWLRYNNGPYQYSERQMRIRIMKLHLKIMRAGGVDLVLTHAPVAGYGDEENIAHRGFEAFLPLLDRWQPSYLVHGHVHKRYDPRQQRVLQYKNTTLINANGKYYLDL